MQGDTGGLALLSAEFLFRSLPDSGRAAVNMAELANQLGRIVELEHRSQQKVVINHQGHPVDHLSGGFQEAH